MLRYEVRSTASPGVAWRLVAQPSRWHEWSPHVRGAWGLGAPEVREGARGAARLLWALPVPAAVTRVEPGRLWRWRVGPVELDHTVDPAPGGCIVGVTFHAAPPVEALLRVSYGPWTGLLMRNLARVAEKGGR